MQAAMNMLNEGKGSAPNDDPTSPSKLSHGSRDLAPVNAATTSPSGGGGGFLSRSSSSSSSRSSNGSSTSGRHGAGPLLPNDDCKSELELCVDLVTRETTAAEQVVAIGGHASLRAAVAHYTRAIDALEARHRSRV